jgi:hypothetical protein
MKSWKLLFVVAALASASFALAEPAQKDPAAGPQKPKCCAEAEKAGKTCANKCCADAAKDGKCCEKCSARKCDDKQEEKK